MISIKRPLNIVMILLIALVITSCIKPTSNYPELDKNDVTIEQQKEQELSDSQKARRDEAKAIRLAAFEKRLKEVGGRVQGGGIKLCSQMKHVKGGCLYDFYILKEGGVNAFADGNQIHVTERMMVFAKKDEELAIVLGHEYAHNIMGHVNAKKTNAIIGTILGAAVDIAVRAKGVPTNASFSKAGKDTGATSFSIEFEKEADYVGLYITALAGYDINHAPEFWRRMAQLDSQSIYTGTTHPTSPERYLALEKTLAEIKHKQHNGEILVPGFKD